MNNRDGIHSIFFNFKSKCLKPEMQEDLAWTTFEAQEETQVIFTALGRMMMMMNDDDDDDDDDDG